MIPLHMYLQHFHGIILSQLWVLVLGATYSKFTLGNRALQHHRGHSDHINCDPVKIVCLVTIVYH